MQKKIRTFEEDDLFGREPYAKFLEKLIINSGQYHRDDDMKAYTIAIDSPWGTGKSVFLEKFENMLQKDCPETIRVVHYNAWQNDFWENTFESFANTIFQSDWFRETMEGEAFDDAAKCLLGAAKNVSVAFLKARLSSIVDIRYLEKAGKGLLNAFNEGEDLVQNCVTKEYRDYTEGLGQLQNTMENFLKETLPGGKLVIVIDELDRCRPTFAIDTLEIVKHIMDVPNVVYLFALDVKQLGDAVKQIYGADTDATGYLMRFFSYYSRLPKAKIEGMVHKIIKDSKIDEKYVEEKSLVAIAEQMMLTVRDVETIGKVYRIMLDAFLGQYQNKFAYELYWTLLCEKYKNPAEFYESLTGKIEANYLCVTASKQVNQETKKKIWENIPMENMYFCVWSEKPSIGIEWKLVDVVIKNGIVKLIGTEQDNPFFSRIIDLRKEKSISGFLFMPDFKRWKKIKHLTPGEFLLQQMEMYDFVPEI